MNAYEFVVDLRLNTLRVGLEKMKFKMDGLVGITNRSIKQVTVTEEVFNRKEEEMLVFNMKTTQ